jgi:hypothetical protein
MGPRLIIAVVVVGESHVRRRSESPDARPNAIPRRRLPQEGTYWVCPAVAFVLTPRTGKDTPISLRSSLLRSVRQGPCASIRGTLEQIWAEASGLYERLRRRPMGA